MTPRIIASNAMIITFHQVQELGESQCDEPEKPGQGGKHHRQPKYNQIST